MQAILGQKLSADINLIAQGAILIGLWIGFYFAHKRKISVHRRIQTSMVLANIFFIALIMVTSFYNYVIRGKTTTGIVAGLMIAHGIAGLVAELTGIYLILRMNTGLIPARLRVRNYKLVMRLLLGLWTLVAIGGFGIYVVRYVAPPPNESAAAGKLLQAADNLSLHAGEMQEALRRNDLPAARRHAEHLINLIEGKHGADYGDADGDGIVEDPGDGMGALPYLDQVLAISGKPADLPFRSQQAVSELRSKILKVLGDAQAVIQSNDLSSVNGQINETVALTGQIKNGPSGSML